MWGGGGGAKPPGSGPPRRARLWSAESIEEWEDTEEQTGQTGRQPDSHRGQGNVSDPIMMGIQVHVHIECI